MEPNNNWNNYNNNWDNYNNNRDNYVPREPFRGACSRNNVPRGTQANNWGTPRSNYGANSSNNLRPPLFRNNGNGRPNTSVHYGNNEAPTHGPKEQQGNYNSRYFRAKSFSENRPSPYSRPEYSNQHYSESNVRTNLGTNNGNNEAPTHGPKEQDDYNSRYFKAKSFSENRPSSYSRPDYSNQHHSESSVRTNLDVGVNRQYDSRDANTAELTTPNYSNQHHYESNVRTNLDIDLVRQSDPLDAKIEKLLNAVKSQGGFLGELILFETGIDNATVIIQNAVQTINKIVDITTCGQKYELLIDGTKMAEGTYQNKQIAKHSLFETVLDDLRRKCFYIIKKRNYEEITTEDISGAKKDVPQSSSMEGSKAHLMMLKMGWGGKGLGSKEQGMQETVADTMTKNISKAGLGEKNVMNEILSILEEFAKSFKVTTLAFDSGFTKDERAHIHKMATQFNLKSKSEGKGDNRRITISKKIARWHLVRELLRVNCENDSYKLIIPPDFANIWSDQ